MKSEIRVTSYAAIFDMDGTLIDNNTYHFKAWKDLFEKYNRPPVTDKLYNEKLSGRPGIAIMREFFNEFNEDDMQKLFDEKSRLYREAYAPYLAPINGLERFLTELKNAGVKIALATSAAINNIDFVMSLLPVRHFFDVIIDGPHVSEPKPHPQIFLKAAEGLGFKPKDCVVFEDSLSGVKAGNVAGMKVVGITTTHQADELQPVDLLIDDYTGLTERRVAALFDRN
ncbi:HAD family phosphatase [Mucilaginibacter sp. PAMB04274]|uniref:HAD family hydrolase n=1 Tax=Mucilaginibacter sp. PAMB04274 TaxID=3138568 RepID=UPI0031F6CAB0